MLTIAGPVHESKGPVVKPSLSKMIFDQNEIAGDAGGFAQDCECVSRVMQNVNEHAAVE